MFFHGIIFTKQGQSHRPTGRGAGSRAATRKPLILLADSGRRILSRGPGICRGSAGDLPGICRGSAGDRQGIARGSPGDRRPGERRPGERQGIARGSTARGSTARGSISGRGPWARSRAVGFRAQGPERQGRDSLKIAPGPGQRKGPPESPLAGR